MAVDLRPFDSGSAVATCWVSTVPAGSADIRTERARLIRPGPSVVLDVVYHPWPTPLAQVIAQSGVAVVSGFDPLLHQAARQVELVTGVKSPL